MRCMRTAAHKEEYFLATANSALIRRPGRARIRLRRSAGASVYDAHGRV